MMSAPQTSEALRQHYREARQRLLRIVPPPEPRVRKARPATPPLPEPSPDDVPQPMVNMLAPCSWRFLVALVAVKHGLSVRDLLGSNKKYYAARPRHEAMTLVYRHTQASMPQVARNFGRHHTSVLHALKVNGGTHKLVHVLPTSGAALRPKSQHLITIAGATPVPPVTGRPLTERERIVRNGYLRNLSTVVIAKKARVKPATVKVIAHRIGAKRPPGFVRVPYQ